MYAKQLGEEDALPRGKFGRGKEANRKFLENFFDSIAKAPSHYRRKYTKNIYLKPLFKKKRQLYKIYKQIVNEEPLVNPMSKSSFYMDMNDHNYALVPTKNDLCDTCSSYRAGNITEEEFTRHRESKQMARDAKELDKKESPPTTMVFTVDTQALLISSSKLNIHSLTYFNLKSKETINHLWIEVSAGLESSPPFI